MIALPPSVASLWFACLRVGDGVEWGLTGSVTSSVRGVAPRLYKVARRPHMTARVCLLWLAADPSMAEKV